jgi:hypothetical protein
MKEISLVLNCHNVTKHAELNLGCLHPVARVRSDDVGFYPSTQRHYRRLICNLYITRT